MSKTVLLPRQQTSSPFSPPLRATLSLYFLYDTELFHTHPTPEENFLCFQFNLLLQIRRHHHV